MGSLSSSLGFVTYVELDFATLGISTRFDRNRRLRSKLSGVLRKNMDVGGEQTKGGTTAQAPLLKTESSHNIDTCNNPSEHKPR